MVENSENNVKEEIAGSGNPEPTEMKEQITAEQVEVSVKDSAEYKELQDKYLRLAAEFDNYKKRMVREYSRALETSADEPIRELLAVIDDFERALAYENSDVQNFRQGVNLIYTKLMEMLAKRGLVKIAGKGEQFDPIYHDAVMQLETDEYEEGKIVEEVQKGYTINGRVLRPARVVVAKRKTGSGLPINDSDKK
ncbi:MAG: nucleotide exchange factor GrpE [candidate division Zixibacteria bacterium]|jgi:molecular chaperone GrpE|nr:nucleotide exchange factor GrpE [candidate division Zixibacteria bacterium]